VCTDAVSGLLSEFAHFHVPCGVFVQSLRGEGMRVLHVLRDLLLLTQCPVLLTVDEADAILARRPHGANLRDEASQCARNPHHGRLHAFVWGSE